MMCDVCEVSGSLVVGPVIGDITVRLTLVVLVGLNILPSQHSPTRQTARDNNPL